MVDSLLTDILKKLGKKGEWWELLCERSKREGGKKEKKRGTTLSGKKEREEITYWGGSFATKTQFWTIVGKLEVVF